MHAFLVHWIVVTFLSYIECLVFKGKGSRELMFLDGLRFYIFLISPPTPPQTYLPLPSFMCLMSKTYPNPFGLSPNPPVTPKPKASFSFSFDLNCYKQVSPVHHCATSPLLYFNLFSTQKSQWPFIKHETFFSLLLLRLYFLEQF